MTIIIITVKHIDGHTSVHTVQPGETWFMPIEPRRGL